MEQLAHRDLQSVSTVLRQLYAHGDLETFPAQSLAALSGVVPANILGYNEVNLRRQRLVAVTDPSEVAPSPDEEQFVSHYLSEQVLLTRYQRTRDGRAYKMSDFLSQSQFHRLALYNEFYHQRRTEDLMLVVLPTATNNVVLLLVASRSRRTFSERDRRVLNVLRPHLLQAYNNATTVTHVRQEAARLKQALEESRRGIILLTRTGHVQLMTDRARQWLQEYFGQSARHHTCRLPENLWQWVRHQQSTLAPNGDVPPPRTPLVVEREGKRLVVRLLTDQAEGQTLLLLEEQRTIVSPALLAPLGLAKRESEILHWIAQGKSNKEVAMILSLSPHTVRTRLENVYGKLGVKTRTAAAVRAVETLGLMRR